MLRFLNKSLRRQLILGVVLVHAVMMSIFVYDLVERQRDFLLQRQLDQTRIRAENLSVAASAWVLSRDYAGMSELINAQNKDPEIRYAMLVDPAGVVLAHSDSSKIGKTLVDAKSRAMLQSRTFFWSARSQALSDGAAPITVNRQIIGWARIGMTEKATLSKLRQASINGMAYTLLAILIGSILAWLMAQRLTRRLDTLRQTMDKVKHGATNARVELPGEDEAACLADDFNTMLDRLASREQDLESTRQELAKNEARFDMTLRNANIGLWDWDLHNHVYFSNQWKSLRGYQPNELSDSPRTWEDHVHPDDLAGVKQALARHLAGESEIYDVEYRTRHKDGYYFWVMDRGAVIRNTAGEPVRMTGINTDITHRKLLETQLFEEKELAQITLSSIGDAVITTDAEGRVTFMNKIAEHLTGWPQYEAIGLPVHRIMTLINEETGSNLENPVEQCRREGATVDMLEHTALIARNGRQYAVEDSAAPIFSHTHELIGTVMVFHDVSEKRAMSKQMIWQLSHDVLTGLANRYAFELRLHELESSPAGESQACLYIDLDQFKLVNDTVGHTAGDELLRQLGNLMQKEIRQADLLARLGGDEFGILLDNCPTPRALEIAEQLRGTIAEYRFAWEGKFFDVGVSIGLVIFNAGNMSAAGIMSAADMACYEAKRKGRNRVHLYQQDTDSSDVQVKELEAAAGIRAAIKENRLVLYAQEIRPVQNGSSHYEILVRFIDEQGQLKAPAAIIQAAERFGLMGEIDRWVVRHSFKAARTSAALGFSINLSGQSLADESFSDFIRQELAALPLDTRRICFEITETAAISHLSIATQFIREMKALGFSFSLDDFGSGMSSFAYLKHLPIDYIKIDGVFVRDIVSDPLDRAFVQSINHIGRVMGKKTIAEFVENDAILDILKLIGVDFAQGYGISQPEPLEQLLARQKLNAT